ncbi:MAG TPA: tetratricopeptide repeat protein [Cyclobacteriaceae bacterium]
MKSLHKILLIAICLLVVVGLYQLPKSVVDNEKENISESKSSGLQSGENQEVHDLAMNKESRKRINNLKSQLNLDIDNEKKAKFADSLARLYFAFNQLDSGEIYSNRISDFLKNEEGLRKKITALYFGFNLIMEGVQAKGLGESIRKYINEYKKDYALDDELKNILAMTYVSSDNPMKGIMMLREIVEEDSENVKALLNLGLLSMKTGQYEKAVQRLEKVRDLEPTNLQGRFSLAISYNELGNSKGAMSELNFLKDITIDSAILSMVNELQKEIQ